MKPRGKFRSFHRSGAQKKKKKSLKHRKRNPLLQEIQSVVFFRFFRGTDGARGACTGVFSLNCHDNATERNIISNVNEKFCFANFYTPRGKKNYTKAQKIYRYVLCFTGSDAGDERIKLIKVSDPLKIEGLKWGAQARPRKYKISNAASSTRR